MKKWMLYLGILFLLTGCGNIGNTGASAGHTKDSAEHVGTNTADTERERFRIGIVQVSENPSFSDMRQGFMDGLREQGYDESRVEFIFQDAGGSQATLNTILQFFHDQKMDMIVPLVTSATQAAVNMEGDIPIVFISVTDPVGAGIMTDLDKPDKQATGTCNEVPIEELFSLAEKLTPPIQKVGILYDPGLPNSVLTVERAKEYFAETGIDSVERAVTNSSEVQAATQVLCDQADVIYVPIDSTILSAMPQVVEVALQAGKPVYGSAPSMVSSGALASISVSEYETGRQSARLAAQVLEGTPVEEIPAVVVNDFLTVINRKMAENLQLQLPTDIAETAEFVE